MYIFDYFASIIEDRFMTDLKDYITNDYKAIDAQETIGSVQDFFGDLTFSHFPVIEEEIPVVEEIVPVIEEIAPEAVVAPVIEEVVEEV